MKILDTPEIDGHMRPLVSAAALTAMLIITELWTEYSLRRLADENFVGGFEQVHANPFHDHLDVDLCRADVTCSGHTK